MSGKNYAVRVMCPHGDGDQWILLQDREESLKQILDTPWDFECPAHGVQREFPLTATERTAPAQPRVPAEANRSQPEQRLRRRAKEPRLAKAMGVTVRGWDRNGNRFTQTATSINISRSGGRLHGVGFLTAPGNTIEVKRFLRKARFLVIWAGPPGTPQANEIGIYCLEPNKNFWGLPQSARQMMR